MRILPLQKLFSLLVLLCTSALVFAQPANDDCSTPTIMILGADSLSCIPVPGDTRGTVDATLVPAPAVCSGTWFTDDVWFSFTTDDNPPTDGVTVEVRLDPSSGTELMEQGMAIYQSCDLDEIALACFSDAPGVRTIQFPPTCIAANSTYIVRVWSAPLATDNSGTFSICAYASPPPAGEPGEPMDPPARIIYEETFDEGFNDWTPVSETSTENCITGDTVETAWVWSNNGCVLDFGGGANCQTVTGLECQEVGVIGMQGGWYQTNLTGDVTKAGNNGAPPYDNILSYVVSPPIDLSKEDCVNLTWVESARYLNGGGLSNLGGFVQYSLDDGATWVNPSMAINTADITENYGGEYVVNGAPTNALQRSIPLLGAQGNTNVRIRFGFNGDFYFWIIDDIRLVEGTAADAVAQNNFFARATINPQSVHMVDCYDFLIDIANLACEDLTNLNANMTITNAAGDEVHNVDLPYGTVQSDSLAENQSFLQEFCPEPIVADYTATYTVSADRDDDLSNNVRTFPFSVVDEMQFRKEDGTATGQINPNTTAGVFWGTTGDTAPTEPFKWEVGNMFFAPRNTAVTGEPLAFNEISFQLANATDIIGDFLVISLYSVNDADQDNLVSKEAGTTELTRLAIGEYTVTGAENGLITVPIAAFGNPSLLEMQANTHYLASVENTTDAIRAAAMSITNDVSYDYSAALFNTQQNFGGDLTQLRYGNAFGISKENFLRIGPGFTGDLTSGNFAAINTPVIRLGFEAITTSTVEINKNIEIAVSPNPTAADITVNLSVAQPTDMEVSIVDLAGRIISSKSFNAVTELREDFNLNALSNGVYFVHINTVDGVQTKKFVVSK